MVLEILRGYRLLYACRQVAIDSKSHVHNILKVAGGDKKVLLG